MPPSIEASIKRRVIQQWLSGDARPKIAMDNNVGEGTIGSIINYFKIGLDSSEFDSARELALHAKKQGFNLSDLASNFRLHNFIKTSGAAEDQIQSFLTNVSSTDMPPEKIIELVNEIYYISKSNSISPEQVPGYIKEKLEQKQKIDEEIQEADTILQSKNATLEAIDEHIKLNEKLKEHGISTDDIYKLLNLLSTARRYGFDGKEIATKLYNIQDLELKERELKDKRKKLSKRISKYKDIIPFIEEIVALGITVTELLALKIGIKEAAKHYNLSFVSAALQLIDDIKRYNKTNHLKKELDTLRLQKYALDQACSRQSQSLIALASLKNHGITDEQIISMNNFLQNTEYKSSNYARTK